MKKNKGFTLIEIIISIAIISIVGLSVMQMFSTSSKVNRKSKEIDHANLKATSIIEKIKNNPDKYAKGMKLSKEKFLGANGQVVTMENEANSCERDYKKEIYYDYQWNEVEGKKNGRFKSTVNLHKKVRYGAPSDFNPKKYSTNGKDKAYIDGTTNQYFIVVTNPAPAFGNTKNYEFYIIKDHTKESFIKWLYDEQNGYRNIFIDEYLNNSANYNKTHIDAIEAFAAAKERGLNELTMYATRSIQKTASATFENTESKDRAIDSIPLYLDFKDLDKKYNIEVYNISNKNVDIYLQSNNREKTEENVKFISSSGAFGVTYLSDSRKDETNFDAEVKVVPVDSNKKLAELEIKAYRPN